MKLFFFSFFIYVSVYAGISSAKDKTIKVLIRNAPTTFYYGSVDMIRGFEYDLVEAFAKDKNYKVEYILKDFISGVYSQLYERVRVILLPLV
ncbi:MAG: hypothetical protein Q9M43_14620 [Sulfurimonas sp.]|nr:hypothetical protein [Sulfurimonas sp.]